MISCNASFRHRLYRRNRPMLEQCLRFTQLHANLQSPLPITCELPNRLSHRRALFHNPHLRQFLQSVCHILRVSSSIVKAMEAEVCICKCFCLSQSLYCCGHLVAVKAIWQCRVLVLSRLLGTCPHHYLCHDLAA